MRLGTLINKLKEHHPGIDEDIIRKAYKFAEKAHKDQMRESGEPFIQHPLNVAYILAQMKLGQVCAVSALLHDTVEDTDVTLEQVSKEFGLEVAAIVDGATNIKKLSVP